MPEYMSSSLRSSTICWRAVMLCALLGVVFLNAVSAQIPGMPGSAADAALGRGVHENKLGSVLFYNYYTSDISSASVNTRLLEQSGFIEQVSRPGDRRDYYSISPDMFERTMAERLARWHRLHDIVIYGITASDLSPAVRTRLKEFEQSHNSIREVLETALTKLRTRRKR